MSPAEFKNKFINNDYETDFFENEFIFEKYVKSYKTLIDIYIIK